MSALIQTTASVQPDGTIRVATPNLKPGQVVTVFVAAAPAPAPPGESFKDGMTFLEWLDSLPAGPRSAGSAEELERRLQEERDSWDR